MLCKSLLESLKSGVKFKDPESTFCLTNRTFNWFNSTDSLPLHQLETIQRVQDECPENCTCELDRLNFDLNNTERKTITTRVACTGLGLTKFPDRLPAGTVTLNISNNNVSGGLCEACGECRDNMTPASLFGFPRCRSPAWRRSTHRRTSRCCGCTPTTTRSAR